MLICEINVIILTCRKLEWVGPVQQKIKLPSPYLLYFSYSAFWFNPYLFVYGIAFDLI